MTYAADKKWIREHLCAHMARTCNLYCVYCQNPPAGKPVPKEKVTAWIKEKTLKR